MSAQEIKTSHGTHIQAPKTNFRCHGHDLRSTKNSQTLFIGLTFLIWQLTNLLSLAIRILKLSWTYHFFIKEALQVFWVQRYDLLSQINYHKYLQSMDKSMCQWINQSINKSIYKCPKTPWSKVLIQSKTHAFLLSCLFKAKSKFLSQVMWQIYYFLFFTVLDGELKEIQVSSWKNLRLSMRLTIYEDVSFVQLASTRTNSLIRFFVTTCGKVSKM